MNLKREDGMRIKRFCLLSEHYYEKDIDEIAIKKQIANQVKNCILNFEKSFLQDFLQLKIFKK